MATITGLVVLGNQRHFGAKVAARILSFYCRNFCRRSNQKKCYKHVALELTFCDVICHVTSQQFFVACLPKTCKIILQQSKMRNIDLNRALGNNIQVFHGYAENRQIIIIIVQI